ncbi:GNAT family N-acetyltransferase [Bacteroides oleiciplenus]|uniref:N-acetyltransferase domain-containing protein n=1 Tax=Bacteroides oleiciplenus YIT 12058 TaxID=742727 RepID=K9EMY6_9BACE|nr:GNAT family N-acetyltransferase [Bacteroides oleiciplenus]EKU90540.1 hypothetical protein HMPREF9447_01958 [Bacteroides oleiciplenus YIT 12058]
MREKVRKLWKLCFSDSKEFVDMYFHLRYNSEVNVAIESGDEVIAALQMLPYPMTFCGSEVPTAYVSGACTHPDYRSRGVMRELLSQAFGRMYRNDVAFSTLIPAEPWLFDYYARMGYVTAFHYGQRTFHLPADGKDTFPPTGIAWQFQTFTDYSEDAYQYLNRKMQERPCCLQHTEGDFRVILADLNLSEGYIFTLSNELGISALAIAYPDENLSVLHIGELLSDTPEAEHLLLTHICRRMQAETLHITQPLMKDQSAFNLGMIRIIQAKPVLQLYAATHPEEEMNIDLVDEQLSANNGYYYLNKGKCMYSHRRIPGAHERLTIGQLTEKIFSGEKAYMSLMLN